MCQGQRPADIGNDRRYMQGCRAGDTRFAGLARNIHAHAETIAKLACFDDGANAAQLDRLEANATGGLAFMMPPDVIERMNTFIGTDRNFGRGGDISHAVEVVPRYRLFEEIETASVYGAHIRKC